MPNPTIRIHNTQTDEIIDREMTNEEFAIYEADSVASQARQIAEEALRAKKQEVLEKLGLTADEVAALLA
jgi:hexokinase